MLFLAGPTAVGKSEVALTLAERLQGEIVSVDSMQVYRGLDIGTAKPSAEQRKRVRHHLVDVVNVADAFDAGQFIELANRALQDIHKRGRFAVLCGGTGLYFKALLEGLGKAPPSNLELRAELERTATKELLKELAEKDRVTFERIDHKNPRRVIRALEVIRLTGKPFSAQRSKWSKRAGEAIQPNFFGMKREPGDLHDRIDRRVDEMFERGLVEETRYLLSRGV